jgi:hypothetical protein
VSDKKYFVETIDTVTNPTLLSRQIDIPQIGFETERERDEFFNDWKSKNCNLVKFDK